MSGLKLGTESLRVVNIDSWDSRICADGWIYETLNEISNIRIFKLNFSSIVFL